LIEDLRVDQLREHLKRPLVELLLSVADDKFVLGHRNADWTGLAPVLEEDIAFSALSQDEIAHASALYEMVAQLLGTKADRLAFGRRPDDYRCAQIVELSDEFDWAKALCRNFFCDHFDALRLGRLAQSRYRPLGQLGSRLAAEEHIHVQHVDSWMRRLGNGTPESHRRMQEALAALAPLASTLLEPTQGLELLEAEGVYPKTSPDMFERWSSDLKSVGRDAGLNLELQRPRVDVAGGRHGIHSEAFLPLLDELTEVYRIEPEAAW
jgi:ring-1,2-phenylacetyl-CoA epoxidase subunit PaaC